MLIPFKYLITNQAPCHGSGRFQVEESWQDRVFLFVKRE
jgi:hypothetical protein